MSQLAFKTFLNNYWLNRGDGKYSWNLNYLTVKGRVRVVCLPFNFSVQVPSPLLCRWWLKNWLQPVDSPPKTHVTPNKDRHWLQIISSWPTKMQETLQKPPVRKTEWSSAVSCWLLVSWEWQCASVVGGVCWDKAEPLHLRTYVQFICVISSKYTNLWVSATILCFIEH